MQNLDHFLLTSAIIIAIIYALKWLPKEPGTLRSIFKTLPVAILALFAYLTNAPFLLVLALILSAAGDAFLSRNEEQFFLLGLGSFLSAHIAFIILFVTHPSQYPHSPTTLLTISIFSILFTAIVLRNLWPQLGAMKLPVVIYTLIIGAMNIAAWATAQPVILLIGVASFIVSDTVLAHTLFYWQKPKTRLIGSYVLWFTYIAAQILIILGITQYSTL